MKKIVIQAILLALIVFVNLPPSLCFFTLPAFISPLSITIVLALSILLVTCLQNWRHETLLSMQAEEKVAIPESIKEAQASTSLDIKNCQSLSQLIEVIKQQADASDSVRYLDLELKTLEQCRLWIYKMEEKYGKEWRTLFQGAEMPVKQEDFPRMRSLIMDIALHTVDFCRYRTGYVNLTEQMKVNPTMLLLDKEAVKAGAKPINTDPFKIDKEVRVLHQLIRHDGISLKEVTIHGYYLEDK